jgi:PAS domain S-box-containing protein
MNILTVDDDPVTLLLLQRMLTKQGHRVTEARDGDEALSIFRKDPPEILLIDWEMPRMKGTEVCRVIRADPSMKKPYIIMLTSRVGRSDRMQGFASGVDDYLNKPVDPEELNARVRVGERIVRMQQELDQRARNAEIRFQNLFDNSPSGILQVDDGGRITRTDFSNANRSFCTLLDYPLEGLIGTSFLDLVHPSDRPKMERVLVLGQKDKLSVESRLMKRSGGHVWTAMNIVDVGETSLIIVDDITKEKLSQQEIMMRTMRYRIEEGKVYSVRGGDGGAALEAFSDALTAGYDGIALSRSPEREFRRRVHGQYSFYWIANKGPEGSIRPEFDAIRKVIESAPHHEVFFMDGLDYICRKADFMTAFDIVTTMREAALLKDSIALFSMDAATLSDREIASLEKECVPLTPYLTVKLDEDLTSVLRAVYLRESRHIEASFGSITEDLGLSRPTVRKRVNELVSFDYLQDLKRGRRRTLSLSDKGKKIFAL